MAYFNYDITVIGGGIVGIATAMQIALKYPSYSVGVVEKEDDLAEHQTGHNSGVIHSGIYYAPGSLKAKNCVTGAQTLLTFCDENEHQVRPLRQGDRRDQRRRAAAPRRAVPPRHRQRRARPRDDRPRPRCRRSSRTSPASAASTRPRPASSTTPQVTRAYARHLAKAGGEIILGAKVDEHPHRRRPHAPRRRRRATSQTKHLINCAGLYSDAVARMMGLDCGLRIVPFRGEYFFLRPEAHGLVKGLIYPVPDPEFPFLGVHFTRTIHGGVEAGPNAVLALARRATRRRSSTPKELAGHARPTTGFWTMARKYWKTGMQEVYRSLQQEASSRRPCSASCLRSVRRT